MNQAYVVDASVGIKLFVAEDLSETADRFFAQLAVDPPVQFYVPDLFYVECANILWKYVWRFNYPAEDARQNITDLRNLALTVVSTADIIGPALELALKYEITVYDASYAALAEQISVPLVTADMTLVRKLKNSELQVYELQNIKL